MRNWATEMACVSFLPDKDNAPSIDGMIQLFDESRQAHFYLLFQVKCGPSHIRSPKRNKKNVILRLDAEEIKNWQQAHYPVIIVWVSDDLPSKRYALWEDASRANPSANQIRLSKKSFLDDKAFPALLELARNQAGFPSIPLLGERPLFPVCVRSIKHSARHYFRLWQKEGSYSPKFGRVQITLRSWRHITRTSVPQQDVCHKLALLPLARETLEKSNRSYFLRLLNSDWHPSRTKQTKDVSRSDLWFNDLRRELHSVRGVYRTKYRKDILIEVVLEVIKVSGRTICVRLYGIHERKT